MTLYEILGVPEDATPEQIRAAYRAKAKIWHPDLNKDPRAAEMMKTINQAYEILSDKEKRARYDQWLTQRRGNHCGFTIIIAEDIFGASTTSSCTTGNSFWFGTNV